MGRLNGKVAIVTGAGAGMGRATALLLAKEGAKVMVANRTPETGEETIRLIKDAGGEATFVKTDIAKSKDVQIMVKTAVDTYGKLDIIHNNAGIMAPMDYTTDVVDGSVDKILAVNLSGTLMCIKYAISAMLKSGGGSIINIGSMAALVGMRGTLGYAASKAGIVGASRVAAVEYAAKNIRVN